MEELIADMISPVEPTIAIPPTAFSVWERSDNFIASRTDALEGLINEYRQAT